MTAAVTLAARWADEERAAGRTVSPQMQRRVASALRRGGGLRLGPEETWRRLIVWSRAQTLNRCRPPTPVLARIVADAVEAQRWERSVS